MTSKILYEVFGAFSFLTQGKVKTTYQVTFMNIHEIFEFFENNEKNKRHQIQTEIFHSLLMLEFQEYLWAWLINFLFFQVQIEQKSAFYDDFWEQGRSQHHRVAPSKVSSAQILIKIKLSGSSYAFLTRGHECMTL